MINSVEITNFKNIRLCQKIDIERFTLFVGANGSGKTSVLDAFDYTKSTCEQFLRQQINEKNKSERDLTFAWRKLSASFYTRHATRPITIRVNSQQDYVSIISACDPVDPKNDAIEFPSGSWKADVRMPDDTNRELFDHLVTDLMRLKLDPAKLGAASYSHKMIPSMGSNGEELASTLAYLALNSPEKFSLLVETMKKFIPNLDRIRFTRSPIFINEVTFIQVDDQEVRKEFPRVYQGDALLFDFKNAKGIPANYVSEGTIFLLGILAVIISHDRPLLLLLDDIDRGLHPAAQTCLVEVLYQLLDQFSELQILATTHSPYLIDAIKPEQVRLMALNDEGYAVCGKLTDHAQFERWKDEMAPGELWSLFGEKWVTEGSFAT